MAVVGKEYVQDIQGQAFGEIRDPADPLFHHRVPLDDVALKLPLKCVAEVPGYLILHDLSNVVEERSHSKEVPVEPGCDSNSGESEPADV